MTSSKLNPGFVFIFLLCAYAFTGCGGSKVLKESQPIQITQPLAVASDSRVTATLDWVIVRDGPGTWAKNADWDEYLFRISNESDQPIQIEQLIVFDSLDSGIAPQQGRKKLVAGSKQTSRRYKKSGIKVVAGSGRGATGVIAATTAGAFVGSTLGTGATFIGSAGGAAIGATVVLAPVLAVGGITRSVNHSAVNTQIEERQTVLPLEIPAGEERSLDIFFPLAPSPQLVELSYADADGEHSLVIDTSNALDGLHIDTRTE